jgi:hypothetical protein
VPDCDADWGEMALASWQREHQRLATWIIGARSAGKKVPELAPWTAIEARLQGGAGSACAPADGCTHGPAAEVPAGAHVESAAEIGSRLQEMQAAAVRELRAALQRPARASTVPHAWAKTAVVAAAVAGMAACQPSGPLRLKPDAGGDANQTRDLGAGGGICAVQFDRDALAPTDAPAPGADDVADGGQAVDADQGDAEDAYHPIPGIC